MKLLVTGAGGQIGKEVARELLSHGYEVRALDMQPIPADLREMGAELVYADIANSLEMLRAPQGCDGVLHVAAIPNPIRQRHLLLDSNIKGTYNVLEGAQAAGIEKVIITSSVGALGFSYPVRPIYPDYLPVDVKHPRAPQDVYGLSKEVNELTAEMFTRRHGMTTIAIRPPYVLDLSRAARDGWLQRMMQRHSTEYENALWGYIDTKDLARAFRLAWEAKMEPAGHNIFFVMADDVLSEDTPRTLIERFMPQLMKYADKVDKCFYDLAPAREKLGFVAETSWRDAIAQAKS